MLIQGRRLFESCARQRIVLTWRLKLKELTFLYQNRGAYLGAELINFFVQNAAVNRGRAYLSKYGNFSDFIAFDA